MPLTNQQYNSINRIFEERQLSNLRLQEQRKEEIYRTVPGFQDLEHKIIATSMKYSRMLLDRSGSTPVSSEEITLALREELRGLKLQKAELLVDAGYDKDYLDLHYKCDKCKDTGYIDTKTGKEKCTCFQQIAVDLLYNASQLQENFKTKNFSNLTLDYYEGESLELFQKAFTSCKKFINNFNSDYHNLLFYGTVGSGKTFLSCCVAKELLERDYSVMFFSAIELYRKILLLIDYKDNTKLNNFFDSIYQCDLLIIDDLGTENSTDYFKTNLCDIINTRIEMKKSVIITTNLNMEGIRERYSDRVFSRIFGNYDSYKFSGRDIRIQQMIETNSSS